LATITELAKAKQNRRIMLDRRCREELRARIAARPHTGLDPYAADVLIDAYAGAFVEMTELSAGFLRGNASNRQLDRLHLVRGQVCRILGMLGLTSDAVAANSEPADAANTTPPGGGLAEYLAQQTPPGKDTDGREDDI
jgi:hypothetical protein